MGILRTALIGSLRDFVPQGARRGKPEPASTTDVTEDDTVVTERVVGQTAEGEWITEITLRAESGLSATYLTYGATLAKLVLPDGTNVIAGFEDAANYLGDHPYLGAAIGPVAGRIGGATFTVDDKTFALPANEGPNTLHSGAAGYDRQVWRHEVFPGGLLVLSLQSRDSDHGFPSDSWAYLYITLTDDTLTVEIEAQVGCASPLNITLHPYFNAAGTFDRPVDTQTLSSPCTEVAELDADKVPTGGREVIAGTEQELKPSEPLGSTVVDDYYFAPHIHGSQDHMQRLASLSDGARSIHVETDRPGLVIYTGETLDGVPGMIARGGVAIEPQDPPASVFDAPYDRNRDLHATIRYRFEWPE